MKSNRTRHQESRLDRIERLVEESLRSNQEFRRSTEEFRRSTEEFRRSTEEFIRGTEEFRRSTEESIRSTEEFKVETRRQLAEFGKLLGNVGNTLGLTIEDRGNEIVRRYLKEKEGISVRFEHRKIFRLNGVLREVDLLGQGRRNGRRIWVICECKARAERKDVEEFAQTAGLVSPRFRGEKRFVLFTYAVGRGVPRMAAGRGILVVTPFDVP